MTTKLQELVHRQLGLVATGDEAVRRTKGGNVRAGPGTRYAVVAVVKPTVELALIEQPEGEWLPVAVLGWVHKSLLG